MCVISGWGVVGYTVCLGIGFIFYSLDGIWTAILRGSTDRASLGVTLTPSLNFDLRRENNTSQSTVREWMTPQDRRFSQLDPLEM